MASEKIDALELDITSKLDTKNLDEVIGKLGELSNALGKLKSKTVTVGIKEVGTASKSASSGVNALTTSFFNQAVRITALIAVYRKLADVISTGISNSMAYVENLNLFNVSLGEYADNANKYANTVREAMGIDPSNWIRTQGVFNTLIKGFGVTGDQAAYMSQNLTQLTYDIASFYNLSVSDAEKKVQSAVAGELEPVRRLGYDLSQNALTAIAQNPKYYGKTTYAINQETGAIEANSTAVDNNTKRTIANFNQLTQGEKVQLRYIALMTQVTQVQGDMARTLNDPANQMRIFKEQTSMTARALGNIFIPALNKVLPYVTAFCQVLETAFQDLAALFGFELPDMSERMDIGKTEKPYQNIVTATGKAAKNAKKLKDYTLGIDELNVFKPDEPVSGGSGSGTNPYAKGGTYKTPGYDFLSKAIENSIKKAKEDIDKLFNDIKKNPLEVPIKILGEGASILGENFWEAVLGKSPEQLALDAQKHGRSIGAEFYASLAWSAADSAGDLLAHIMGVSPEELQREAEAEGKDVGEKFREKFFEGLFNFTATGTQTGLFGYLISGNVGENQLSKRAGEAGRTVGEQFALEFGKSCLQLLNNPVMKFIYEKTTGRNLAKDIEAVNKALKIGTTVEKTSNSRSVVGAKGRGHAKEESASNTPFISTPVPRSANLNTIVKNNSNFEKQGKADANAYAKGFGSGASNTQVNANKVFKAGLNGVSDNGNGGTKFYNTSASEAQKYAQGLTSANSNAKSAGKGLYNNAYKGVTESNSGTKSFKYVSFEQAKQYSSNLSSKTAKTNAYNAGVSLGGQAASGAGSKKGSFTTAGQNAGQGFVLGIDKNKSKATTSGMTIAMNALKKLKEVLGIHSPSRAFAEAGMYSVLGFSNAIEDNTFKATNAVALMSERVLATAKTDLTGVLANPLARGNVSMPSSGVGYGIGMSNDTAMASLASQVYQAVVSGMEVVADSLENRDIKVLINGKEVFKAVQTEQRKSGVAISNGAFSTT